MTAYIFAAIVAVLLVWWLTSCIRNDAVRIPLRLVAIVLAIAGIWHASKIREDNAKTAVVAQQRAWLDHDHKADLAWTKNALGVENNLDRICDLLKDENAQNNAKKFTTKSHEYTKATEIEMAYGTAKLHALTGLLDTPYAIRNLENRQCWFEPIKGLIYFNDAFSIVSAIEAFPTEMVDDAELADLKAKAVAEARVVIDAERIKAQRDNDYREFARVVRRYAQHADLTKLGVTQTEIAQVQLIREY